MGELPQEVMEICQRLAKLTETLRGLAELFLNDLSEKTGSHDVVRLHRVLLQMNRALGMFESQSKLWRLASLAQSSGAPVTKWATRVVRDGQIHVWFHCVGIRVSDQLERLLWRSVPHIVVTSATLRSLNSFSRLQEMSGLKEKAGDRFVALDSPFNHVEQGKIIIPQMRYEPLMDNEEQHIAEMAAYFRQQVESKKHLGMLVLFASGRAMNRFLGACDRPASDAAGAGRPAALPAGGAASQTGGKRRAQRAGGPAVLCRRSRFKGRSVKRYISIKSPFRPSTAR